MFSTKSYMFFVFFICFGSVFRAIYCNNEQTFCTHRALAWQLLVVFIRWMPCSRIGVGVRKSCFGKSGRPVGQNPTRNLEISERAVGPRKGLRKTKGVELEPGVAEIRGPGPRARKGFWTMRARNEPFRESHDGHPENLLNTTPMNKKLLRCPSQTNGNPIGNHSEPHVNQPREPRGKPRKPPKQNPTVDTAPDR